ncbi:MAG TPA: hypothetical protein VFI65_18555 [Streptosporangiaceae bacterium]|nr:hypothetical protein [Streptosporangiaceae bacterium]
MSPELPRFSTASGLLSGLFLAVAGFLSIFTGKTAGAAFVIALAPALAVPLLVAVYQQRHADVPGLFGPVAYAVNLIGLGLFGGAAFTIDTALFYLRTPVVDHLKHEPTIAALLGSAALFALGSVLFGVFLLRTRSYPRLLCWAYIVFPALLAVLSPLPDSPLKNAVHGLAGLTIVWLAITLWRTTGQGSAAG